MGSDWIDLSGWAHEASPSPGQRHSFRRVRLTRVGEPREFAALMSSSVSPRLVRTITDLHGQSGKEWLNGLPARLAHLHERWGLHLVEPFANLSYHYVAPGVRPDGTHVVVKLGVPEVGLRREAEALRLLGGRGAVLLLDADLDQGVLVMERLRPGVMLATLFPQRDEQATAHAAEVMRCLPVPIPQTHPFRTVADRAGDLAQIRQHFQGSTGPIPPRLVAVAERLSAELIASMGPPLLVHGDLHHENILSAGRQPWLAIDPKGIVGEPAYEPAAFLCNPMPALASLPGRREVMARRVDQLTEALGLDRRRVLRWAVAQAVLSAWWSLQDHGQDWEAWLECAWVLESILQPRRQRRAPGTLPFSQTGSEPEADGD